MYNVVPPVTKSGGKKKKKKKKKSHCRTQNPIQNSSQC